MKRLLITIAVASLALLSLLPSLAAGFTNAAYEPKVTEVAVVQAHQYTNWRKVNIAWDAEGQPIDCDWDSPYWDIYYGFNYLPNGSTIFVHETIETSGNLCPLQQVSKKCQRRFRLQGIWHSKPSWTWDSSF